MYLHLYQKQIEDYILSCISTDGYDVTCETDHEKLRFLHSTFMDEKGCWALDRMSETEAIKDWLQGLPSAINIEFENYKILELFKDWGIEAHTTDIEEQIVEYYWDLLPRKIIYMISTY